LKIFCWLHHFKAHCYRQLGFFHIFIIKKSTMCGRFLRTEKVIEVIKGVTKKSVFNWSPFSCSSSSLNCTKYVFSIDLQVFWKCSSYLVHFYFFTIIQFYIFYLTSLRLWSDMDMLVNRYFEVETLKNSWGNSPLTDFLRAINCLWPLHLR